MLNCNKVHIEAFSKKYDLNYSAALTFFLKKSEKGYLKPKGKGVYSINKKGSELIPLIKKLQKEYHKLTLAYTKRNQSSNNPA